MVERGGKAQFPYLVDPNTGREMYESDDIVRYLFDTYGDGSLPFPLAVGPLSMDERSVSGLAAAALATKLRRDIEDEWCSLMIRTSALAGLGSEVHRVTGRAVD